MEEILLPEVEISEADRAYGIIQLRHIVIKDTPGNAFKYSNQTGSWIALKGPFDVYITLGYDKFPKIRVMLTVDDLTKRAHLIKNCILSHDIQIENNAKRRKDLFFREYDYTDKTEMETNIKAHFLDMVKNVTDELKKS